MNAYKTRSQFQIQPRELEAIVHGDPFLMRASLAALERQRSDQTAAELAWQLKEHSRGPNATQSLGLTLRHMIGVALVRGERLAGSPRFGVATDSSRAPGTLRTSG
jgi:hypothetical protein